MILYNSSILKVGYGLHFNSFYNFVTCNMVADQFGKVCKDVGQQSYLSNNWSLEMFNQTIQMLPSTTILRQLLKLSNGTLQMLPSTTILHQLLKFSNVNNKKYIINNERRKENFSNMDTMKVYRIMKHVMRHKKLKNYQMIVIS